VHVEVEQLQPDIEWFSIKIELKASYVIMIPGHEQEAIYEAYNRMIPEIPPKNLRRTL
jgi:hypothetical protein